MKVISRCRAYYFLGKHRAIIVLGETDLFQGTVAVFSWWHFKNDRILVQGSWCARWNWNFDIL